MKLSGVFANSSVTAGPIASRLSAFCVALSLSLVSAVSADDTEIYFHGVPTAPPNVLFVLDTSGSMRNPGSTLGSTRMSEMQQAMRQLLGDTVNTVNVNVGLMTFTGHNRTRDTRIREPVRPIETSRADAIQAVNDLLARGGTPTLRALEYARRYFGGELHDEPWSDSSPLLPSPISHECQKNHVVLVTDGSPTADADMRTEVQNNVLGATCLRVDVDGEDNNGNCGAELARYMSTSDARDTIAGINSIKTHTIGFNFDDPWLATVSSAATGGNGTHHNVTSIDGLQEALNNIFASIGSGSFAAPTVSPDSFNESRHRDELYYSQFEPSNRVRWNGNVKKYRIIDGEITGEEARPIVDADGNSVDTSHIIWWDTLDGASVPDGGISAGLPDFEDRNWYTDFNAATGVNGWLEPVRVTPDNRGVLTPAVLGAATGAERNTLVSWALGANVPDDATANHNYIADAMHGTPQLLSYRAKTDVVPQERTEVLYTATNLGVLYAIDPDTGVELWSYTPEEHLPNIKQYFDNPFIGDLADQQRVYGLDGEILMHSTRKATSADYDYEVDKAHLYLTERRGGNRVYALDVTNGFNDTDPFSVMWKVTGGITGTPERDVNGDGTDDFVDLGQTWSKPAVINIRYGCPDACQEKEVLMFGGGYNPLYDDVDLDYATVEADPPEVGHGNAVYLVDADTGDLVWSAGNGNHHSLNLPINHSIPSTPVPIDTNLDGYVDLLYFVDLGGDVWRVDLSKKDSDSGVVHMSGGRIAALNPAGQELRFFNPLDVSLSGLNFSTSNFYLATGSGMRSSPLYVEPDNNRIYAIVDRWIQQAPYRKDPITGDNIPDYNYVTADDGTHGIITADDDVLRNVNDASSTTSVLHGFYKPLPAGHKMIMPTSTRSSRVLSPVYVPPASVLSGCEGNIGTTRLYILALPDGSNAIPPEVGGEYLVLGEGILGPGQVIDTGEGEAPYLIFGEETMVFEEVITGTPVYRRFQRTGWVEQDGY